MADMTGQVALVTGGIRGIGAAICDRLAERGVTIAAGYSRDKEAADTFREAHPGSSVHQGNIGTNADCERVISEVLEQHGRLDVLVNNAGITVDKTVRRMTPEDWDRVVQVNLSGAFYLSRAILQHMLDRGSGRIINISSIIGESGNIGQANYAAAKAGLFGLTMSLAQETARKGITVNSVAPGYIFTEMVAAVPKEALDKVVAKIPVGRLGEADEVARVVEFLADPDSTFITGRSTRSTAASTCTHGSRSGGRPRCQDYQKGADDPPARSAGAHRGQGALRDREGLRDRAGRIEYP